MRLRGPTTEHLAKSVLLEESGNPVMVRAIIWFTLLMLLAFLVWAGVTRVDEVASAPGEVIPSGKVKQVQHLEGGWIAEILVHDGDEVVQGQPLLRLDPVLARSELDQANAELELLRAERVRLTAFVEGKEVDFSTLPPGRSNQAGHQGRIFAQLVASHQAGREVLEQQIAQNRTELEETRIRQEALGRQVELLKEEFAMRESLLHQGLQAKTRIMEMMRLLAEREGELASLPKRMERLELKMTELQKQLAREEAAVMEAALKELAQVDGELARWEEVAKRHAQRLAHTEIRAPVAGVVLGLKAHTIGGVVAGGSTILEVVPKGRQLLAEVKISPKDVGHVHVGQPVTIKFVSYDYARFGGVEGSLAELSPSTLLDGGGVPFYRGVVTFQREYLERNGVRFPVIPGMTLTADIRTGRKSVMEYLLKPIYASLTTALRER